MTWTKAILKIPAAYGEDELGNKTITRYEQYPVKVRLTEWTAEEMAGLDPEYTRDTRKAIIRQSKATATKAAYIVIGEDEYLISKRIISDRWQILHIRGYNQ